MRRLAPLLLILFVPVSAAGAELIQDRQERFLAEVVSVQAEETAAIPGTNVSALRQSIVARPLEGPEAGERISVENDYLELSEGDKFYLVKTTRGEDGLILYAVGDPYRLPLLAALAALLLLLVAVFGGFQGIRGLLSLVGSLALIYFFLLPGILNGYSPVLVSMGVAALIVTLGSYVTHGFTKTTSAAVLGMLISVGLTGLLAQASVVLGKLSGFDSDEAVYLNFDTGGALDFQGLLLGGILIGLLGVLYDAAIGQAVAVEELHRANPAASRRHVFSRALRIGREHIGALVNTLAIAYVGVALPLLLLLANTPGIDWLSMLNRELFSAEVVRMLVGSIGIVLVVPIATLAATLLLIPRRHRDHGAA